MEEEHGPLERALVRQLYRFRCPEPHVLGEFHLGLLEEGRRAEVEAHVRECPHCQGELVTLERFLKVRDRPSVQVLVAELLPRLQVAEPAPAYALRGTLHLASATYRAGEFTLTVSVTEDPQDPSARTVAGILSRGAEPEAGARVRLVGPQGEQEAEADEVGQFAFERVPRGRYTLEVEAGDALVQASPLEVG
jgi:anti-sigma factor RsiW